MQKKIIALAVAGLASTAAFAQSNVQIYGVVDVGYSRVSSSDINGHKTRSAMDSGLQSGSRIGFKGTEDLGNGLKVSFVLEQSLVNDVESDAANDKGTGLFGNTSRQAFLALTSQYGTVAAGRQYTPQYGLVSKLDPFGAGTVGDVTYGRGVYGMGAAAAPKTIRLNNLLAYVSPTFGGGFNVIAGYTGNGIADENATGLDEQDVKVWAINPNYSNGPLFVGLNYHQVKLDDLVGGAGNADYKDKVWDLGASYDFGVVKLAGVYGQVKNSIGALNRDSKGKQWMVGATVPVGGAGAVLVSYSRNKIDSDFAVIDGAKASKWAIGYTHALSKRTNLYAAYAKISTNDQADGQFSVLSANAGINVTNATLKASTDAYTSGLNLGIRHQF